MELGSHRLAAAAAMWLMMIEVLVHPLGAQTIGTEWFCDPNVNWVNTDGGLEYSQTTIDDVSTSSVMSYAAAIARCKELCTGACTGFFYQQHTNTHQICGMSSTDKEQEITRMI